MQLQHWRRLASFVEASITTEARDEPTNKQTKNSTFSAVPAAGEIRAPTKLGTVIEDLEHVLAPLTFGGLTLDT